MAVMAAIFASENVVGREHLGYGEKGDTAVEAEGRVGDAHEPGWRNGANLFHAGPLSYRSVSRQLG